MVKTSRSLLPEQHKETNNIRQVYDGVRGGVSEGQTDNKQILYAVDRILEKYRTCEESTQDRRDAKLVNFIMDEFQTLLKPYIDNYSKTVGLEAIVEQALADDGVQKSVVSEIQKVIRTSIKKLQTAKTDTESTDAIHVLDEKSIEKQFAKNLDDIFDDIKDSRNPELTKYKKLVTDIDKQQTRSIVDSYKNSCRKLFEKMSKESGMVGKPESRTTTMDVGPKSIREPRERKQKNLVDNIVQGVTSGLAGKQETKKRQGSVPDSRLKPQEAMEEKKNYFSIMNEAFKRLAKRISGIFSPFLGKIKKLGGFVAGSIVLAMKWTILPLAKTVLKMGGAMLKGIKFLGRGFVKTLKFFRIDKVMKKVLGVFLDIRKLVGIAAKKTFLAFLKTPLGAYTTGLICGFLWGKIRKGLEGGGWIDGIKEKFEQLSDFVAGFFGPYINDAKNGFYTLIDNYVAPVVDILKPIIIGGADIVKTVFSFALQHPKLVTSALAILQLLPPLMQVLGPAKGVIKSAGGPLNALVAAGILTVAFGIPKLFQWRKDQHFESIGEKTSIFHKFNTTNQVHYQGLDSQDQAKYDDIVQRMNSEVTDLDQVYNDLGDIRKVYKEHNEKFDLGSDPMFKEFVSSVFDSSLFGFDRSGYQRFRANSRNQDVNEQINALSEVVARRYNKLILMRGALSTAKSSKELQKRLNEILEFDSNTGKYVPSERINETVKKLEGDQIFQKDDTGFFEGLIKFDWRDAGTGEREMQFLIDQMEGRGEYYKTWSETAGFKTSTGTEKVSAQEYFNNIKKTRHSASNQFGTTYEQYFRKEPNENQDINQLLSGLGDDNRDIINEKLISYSSDQIKELKEMSENERQRIFNQMLEEWNKKADERNKKREEKTEERVIQELQRLYAEKDYFDRMSISCDNIIGGQE